MDINAICVTLGLDPLAHGLQVLDAVHLARWHFPPLGPDTPALIAGLNSEALAIDCRRVLLLLYPRDHLVTRYDTARDKTETMMLENLTDHWTITQDRPYDTRPENPETPSILFIPPLARPGSFNTLANIVAHLRAPNGCPWDRAQTHQSLRKDFLEECYEALETMDENDIPHLREELGDLLLHILLQTQIGCEAGEFGLSDVIAGISEKLVRRHPHVFGDVKVAVGGIDEIVANWERIKSEEPGAKSKRQKASGIPSALPALMRAQKVAKKQKKRFREKEIARKIERLPRSRNKEKVLGETLFALAAYAETNGVDAEGALRVLTQ